MDIKELLDQVDLVALAERAGAEFHHNGRGARSTCPLHGGDNKTAFTVYSDEDGQHWHCYTHCGGGDALDLYRRWKGIQDVKTAAEELAAEYHIDLDWSHDPEAAERERQRRARADVLDLASRYYQDYLWCRVQALDYLRSRGFTDETIRQLHLGYSDSGIGMAEYLLDHQADMEIAASTGLVRADRLDFTANASGQAAAPNGWITIPYMLNDRTVYFSSRAVEGDTPRPDPKDKSRNLPGHAPAYRVEVRGVDEVILVEGLLDAASLYQLGHSAWAMAGLSGLSESDLEAIKRRKLVYLAPDNDQAGQDQLKDLTKPVARMCTDLGPLTMILPTLEGVKDFNDLLQEQEPCRSETVRRMICNASTWLEYRLKLAKDCPTDQREARYVEIGKLLAAVPPASRSYYYQTAQRVLEIGIKAVRDLVMTALGRKNGSNVSSINDGQLAFLDEPLGNFWAKIERELIIDNGQDQPEVKFEISGGLDDDTDLPKIEIDAGEFPDMKWVMKRWGAQPRVYIPRGHYHKLARAIQEISQDTMTREKEFVYTGWTSINGEWSYLSSSGRISANGFDPNTRVNLGNNRLTLYSLPEPPTCKETCYKAARSSIDFLKIGKRQVTAMLWSSMFAAPLTCEIPLMAMLWVYGQSQSGKSTISMLALTHFGNRFINGRNYLAPEEWLSTFTALETDCFMVKDAPLIIDDFAPKFASRTEASVQHNTAAALVRVVGNRSAKQRSNQGINNRSSRIPRGMVIGTAENPLMGQSVVGRMIYVPVARGDVVPQGGAVNTRLNEGQQAGQAGLYGQAMALYIQWLAKNWDVATRTVKEAAETEANRFRKEQPNLHARLPDYYGLLTQAGKLALSCFTDLGLITASEAMEEYELNRAAIQDVIIQQSETISNESPVRKVFTAIGSLLERGKVYLAPRRGDFTPPAHMDLIGWYDPNDKSKVWMKADTMLAYAKEYWRGLDENLDIMSDALKQQLETTRVLARKGEGNHYEPKVTINGFETRALEISTSMVNTLYDIQLIRSEEEEGLK